MQKLLQQLDDAVAEVFAMMLDRPCLPATVDVRPHLLDSVSASVLFSGTFRGTCALHLESGSAGELAEHLTGTPPEPGSALPADTVGELCNMIAGSWKSRLEPHLSRCHLSPPTVIRGPLHLASAASLTRRYHFAEHLMTLELTLP